MTSPLGGIALTTDLLANASKACPIPVLQTLLGLAALGLEVAAGLQGANQGAQLLARHVGEVALSVTSALDALHDSLPPEVEGSLSHLLSVVRAINDVLQRTSTLGRVQKILQRTTLAVEVKSLRQDLDAAMQTFRLSIILSTSRYLQREETRTKESSERVLKMLESVPPLTATWDLLPPAPHYLFGRDTELGLVTSCLCQRAEQGASLVLLGLGGVGKTSLVLAALHDVRLAQAYSSRRLFISCESAWDASGIVGALASALRLAGDSLRMRVLHALSEAPTLLVLDNLETPWEPKLSRTPVEQLLAAISNLPGMALIVTMRGAERPQGVQWTSPHIPVLQPFDRPAALQTVQHEAPNVSDDELASASLGELLDHLADHPLAVRIIGRLMNHESTDELLQRWKTEGTTLINEGGGDNKSSSLDISIRLSLDSSRMRSHPDTRSLLATLSLFPGGIPDSADGLVFLQPTLPRLLQHISVLKQASLVYINSAQRLSILPPIREYALRHLEPSNSSLDSLTAYCTQLLAAQNSVISIALLELQNLRSVMMFLFKSSDQHAARVLPFVVRFDSHSTKHGVHNRDLLELALALARRLHLVHYQIDILMQLSFHLSEQCTRIEYAHEAMKLTEDLVEDDYRTAAAHINLGRVLVRAADQNCAHIIRGLEMLRTADDTREVLLLRASALDALGLWHMMQLHRGVPAEVAISYQRQAHLLYQQLKDESGMNNSRAFMAEYAILKCDYRGAESTARSVLDFAVRTQDVMNEARVLRVLAFATIPRGDLRLGVTAIRRHSKIFQQLTNIVAYTWSLKTEAVLEIERGQLARADDLLATALEKLKENGDGSSLTAMQCYKIRGTLRAKQRDFTSSVQDLQLAVSMVRRSMAGSGLEESHCLLEMGKMHNMADEPAHALRWLITAMASYRKVKTLDWIVETIEVLGKTFALDGEFSAAWNCWSAALTFHLQSEATRKGGLCLLEMARLQTASDTSDLPTDAASISAADRLRMAWTLLKQSHDDLGLQECMEVAEALQIGDLSLSISV